MLGLDPAVAIWNFEATDYNAVSDDTRDCASGLRAQSGSRVGFGPNDPVARFDADASPSHLGRSFGSYDFTPQGGAVKFLPVPNDSALRTPVFTWTA